MKFRSFFWTVIVGAIATFVFSLAGLTWLVSQSSVNLLWGGVNRFPTGTVFIAKQAPAVVSLLVNPEKLYGLRQVSLQLSDRNRERLEWQQWEDYLTAKIGFNYQKDFKPWLGEEITLAVASLDSDRNPENGAQPGYVLVAQAQNQNLAQESLRSFYSQQSGVTIDRYKGADIIVSPASSSVWSSVFLGDFVLFANQPQILKEAINQAQAIELNINQSEYYRTALGNIQQPHIGIGYIDLPGFSAWLNKSPKFTPVKGDRALAVSLFVRGSNLAAQTILPSGTQALDNFLLDNPELQTLLAALPFGDRPFSNNSMAETLKHTLAGNNLLSNSAYIKIKGAKSWIEDKDKIPLYQLSKLALQSLFPHLKAITVHKLETKDETDRANILFELDS